jgi:hypothetical protein
MQLVYLAGLQAAHTTPVECERSTHRLSCGSLLALERCGIRRTIACIAIEHMARQNRQTLLPGGCRH